MQNLFRSSAGVLLLASVLLSQNLFGQNKERTGTEHTVVFVCEHGAAKSIIAAAEFNKLAKQKGLPYRAVSRGTSPDSEFAPNVVTRLKKNGFAVQSGKPEMLTEADVHGAERLVTLGCKIPENLKPANTPTDWGVASPSKDYPAAQADIMLHVQQLIGELAAQQPPK